MTTRIGPKRIATLVLAIACLATAQAGLADEQQLVAIHVRTVLATDSPAGVDSRLLNYRRQLHQLFHFTSYRLVKEEERHTSVGNTNNFEIPGGRYLEVLPMQFKEDRVRLRVLLIEGTNPPPLDTDFTVPNHGNIWVGGPKNAEGVLLISIGAEATR